MLKKVFVFVLVATVVAATWVTVVTVFHCRIAKADIVNDGNDAVINAINNGVFIEERVINLPEDSGKWFISIAGDRGDRRYDVLLNWFDSSAKLHKVKVQVHFWRVDSSSPLYQRRFASSIKGLPAVRVQKPDGAVVYQVSGKNIPTSAEGLYAAMADAINKGSKQCPDGRCPRPLRPRPRPEPTPTPQPDPEPQPIEPDTSPIIPDTTPVVVPDTPAVEPAAPVGLSTLAIVSIAVACAVAGGILGLVIQWKKTYNL